MTKTHARATLLATTTALTIIASANAAPNVVVNPDFESGLTGWLVSCPSGVCISTSGGNPGNAFQGFNNAVTPGTLSQTLATGPGIYQINFDYKESLVDPNNSLSMQFGAASSGPLSLSTSYQPAMRIFAAGAANPTITFLYKTISGSGVLRVDNVSVVMVDDGQGNNIAAASQTVAVQASRDFMDRLYDRFGRVGSPIQSASVRETILASSDGSAYVNAGGKYRAFMSVFGSDAQWDHADTRADRKGVSAGFEFTIGHGIDLGAAFAFSETDFDTTSTFTRNRGEAEEFLGAIYGHWSARSLPMYVTAILGYGDSTNDFRRTSLVGLGSVFARDVDATQWFGGAEIGWDWNMASRLTLTPYARIDTANIDQDGYSETPVLGALLVPAVVAGRDVDATRSIVGVRAAYDLDVGKRGAKLGGKVGWAHEFDDDRFVTFTETTGPVTFAGSASAATPSEDSVVAGASVEVALDDRASFYAGYNGDFASDQEIHAGEVGLRVTW